MSVGETPPPIDLTTAAVDAINIILTELNISPLQLLLGLFSGKPKFEDTENVIAAYNQSAYWPLHALAADMQIWVKNGAPISDSNPAVQASFGVAKQGTVTSIQGLAGVQQGPSGPGYWTIFQLIELSWKASGDGEQAVLQYVKALDALTQVLSEQKPPSTPPPVPPPIPPGTPPPTTVPCDSGDPNADEVLDLCNAVNSSLAAILAALKNQQPTSGGGGMDACCIATVAAITALTQQLIIIAKALTFGGKNQPSVDLSGITAALQALVAAVLNYEPAFQACCAAINNNLSTIAKALGPEMGANLKPIVDQLAKIYQTLDVPMALAKLAAKEGLITGEELQIIEPGELGGFVGTFIKNNYGWLTGPLDPNIGKEVGAALKATALGQPVPKIVTHSFVDVVVAYIATIGGVIGGVAAGLIEALMVTAKSLLSAIGDTVTGVAPELLNGLPVQAGTPAAWALTYVQSAPKKGEIITVDNYFPIVQDAMGRAGTVGMLAYGAAMIGGFMLGPWEKAWGEVAALLATAAGFEEISARALGPFLDAIIRNRATQDANRNWPTRVPPAPQGLALWSRRKITDAQRDQLLGYGGLDPDWRPPMELGAFRPLQPRVVVNAFLDQPIDRNTLVALLEDAALSPANVQTMADAIIYKSIANVRNSYLSALVTGYGKGVISDQELNDALTQFNFSTEAKQYVTSHVLILRREVLAAEAEKTVVPLVANGNISADEGLQQLEAAGIQPWYAELQITLATTRATIHAAKLEAAAERKLTLARQREATRAAVAEFEVGTLDAAALTAALLLAGLDPILAASVVAVEEAKRTGRLRVVFGQLLSPADAKLLSEKVAAIEQQTKDQLITLGQAATQLQALNIDTPEIDALVSRWAATLKKSPGAAVLLTP